jgi:hypothetical protein
MRIFRVVFVCATLCGLAGCSSERKSELTPETRSSLPSMQKYNDYVGRDYWVTVGLQLCEQPTSLHCSDVLKVGTHLKLDSLVPNHTELVGTSHSFDEPYFHVIADDGRSGFTDARLFWSATTTVDPVVAAEECKKKGNPKLGMNAKQVAATCWGPPKYVNAKTRATGRYEQYVYGDDKFVYLRDGVVTSVSVKGRRPDAVQSMMR